MAEIGYFLVPVSPFSYLAGLGLEAVAVRQGATIAYRPVQLLRSPRSARRRSRSGIPPSWPTASRTSPPPGAWP